MVVKLIFSIWSVIYASSTVIELSQLNYGGIAGTIKNLSFLIFIPFLLKKFSFGNNKNFFLLYSLIFSYVFLISLSLVVSPISFSNIYSKICIPFFIFFSICIKNNRSKVLILKFINYSLILSLMVVFIYSISHGIEVTQYTNRIRFTAGLVHAGKFANIIFSIMIISFYLYRRNIFLFFAIVCFLLLILSSTKNIILASIISLLIVTFYKYRVFLFSFFLFPILIFVSLIFSDPSIYNIANKLLSGRLNWWRIGFQINNVDSFYQYLIGRSNIISPLEVRDGIISSIFHFDNSYFEIFIRDGLFGLLLMIFAIWLGVFHFGGGLAKKLNVFCFAMMLIYYFFDSGLFSTGNLLFVVLWLILSVPDENSGLKCASSR